MGHTQPIMMLTLDIQDWVIRTIAVLALAILLRITLVAAPPLSAHITLVAAQPHSAH